MRTLYAANAGSFLRYRKRFAQDQFGWRELRRGFCPCTSALEMLLMSILIEIHLEVWFGWVSGVVLEEYFVRPPRPQPVPRQILIIPI